MLGWTFYIATFHTTIAGFGWVLLSLTCPIALLRQHALSLPLVLIANAATYALLGTLIESVRLHRHTRAISA